MTRSFLTIFVLGANWLDWATFASSVAAIITAAAALVAFGFLRNQQEQVERQIIGSTSRYMYEEMSSLLALLLDRPRLRRILYEGEQLDAKASADCRAEADVILGLYADFLEQLIYQRDFGNLARAEYDNTWSGFTESLLTCSGELRDYISRKSAFYSPNFVAHVQEISESTR